MRIIEIEKYEALKNVILTLQANVNVGNVKSDDDLKRDIIVCKEVLLEFMPYDAIGGGMNKAIEYSIEKEKEALHKKEKL